MIVTLATLNPDHEIFQKSYAPQLMQKKMQSDSQVTNKDNFFTGLPQLKLSELKGKVGSCFTKEEKLQIRMEREKEKMMKCNARLEKISEQMQEAN